MSKNTILQYNPKLKSLARKLRQNSTLAEILLWKNIKGRALGYEFHRQVPIDEFIIDFYCHELRLAIEVDGYTHDYNFINDKSRQNRIESFGIKVIRFTDADIKKFINDVIRRLRIVISEIEEEKRVYKKGHPPGPFERGRTSPQPPSKGELKNFNQYLTCIYFETIIKSCNFNKCDYDKILHP